MDTPSQSPPQSPPKPAKITKYSRKQKRRREESMDAENRSAQNSESGHSDGEQAAKRVSKSPNTSKKLTDMSPPESTTPVASRSAKRPRVESDVPDNVSVKSKKGHVRGSSSVASLKNIQSTATSTPPSSKKPVSIRGHKPKSSISQLQIAPSESDFDDGASVADSVMTNSNRVRRTEEERIEYFKNQPECGSLEPNRVKCTRCQKYVSLGKQTTYNVRPWEKHRAKCDLKPAVEHQASPEATDGGSAATPRTRLTEEERKGILLADPNIQEVEPEQVLCKNCTKWIRLNNTTAYDLSNWKQHNRSCNAPIPSSRVATAARKLQLVNDEQVKSFSTNTVVCATCNITVELTKDVDYNLTLWNEHKAGCDRSKAGSVPFPTRSPSSVGSSSTVVAPEAPAPKGVKRRLEDTEVELPKGDPDARPQVRPRTEEYVAPDKEPPSVLGWFVMPFKSFVRGFRESMSKGAPVSDIPSTTSTSA
ncbi:hypothetical protein GYMLUDRAFT_51165 [Collybiopsis luxurians FD-317 M1]|uniref:Uncharacterized protein n=1 Tax=Collybiopsis luxurians FD-317 M1 TaxID=944289 RepID=A0A0D0BYI0_9AGAR|nr:hypothetical protein GYMLUDRAFT_51165 [Collybiopsis luxurians FD-317 M1]